MLRQLLVVATDYWGKVGPWSDLGGATKILLVYGLSLIGGFVLVGAFMWIMRRTVDIQDRSFAPLDFWVGGTERCVATTLVFFAPGYLASFIGAWIALKFAANWKRQEPLEYVTRGSLLFLVGNVISFAVAIASGLLLNPSALEIWAEPPR